MSSEERYYPVSVMTTLAANLYLKKAIGHVADHLDSIREEAAIGDFYTAQGAW